jgi:hypothetical protein
MSSQSQIVHGIRSNVRSIEVSFEPKEHQCKYRNVKGQYVCNKAQYNNSLCSEFCEEHFKDKNIFTGIFKYELNYILMCYEEAKHNQSAFVFSELIEGVSKAHSIMMEYSDKFVEFSLDELSRKVIQGFNIIFKFMSKNRELIRAISPFQIGQIVSMRRELEILNVQDRLKYTRMQMVNEKIALNMLSEIYLTSNGSDKLSVFTKDINNKILSFLQ